MSIVKRFLMPLLLMLGAVAGGVTVSTVVATPAYAQTNPGTGGGGNNGGGGSSGGSTTLTSLINLLSNAASATPTSMRAVYDDSYRTVKAMGCWGCTIFNTFAANTFTAGQSVSSRAAGTLSGVIVAIASLFSLFYIGSAFVSGDASDLLSRWKVFWRLCIAVAAGTAWMTGGSGAFNNTWSMIYGPLLLVPMGVADAVPGGSATSGDGCSTLQMPGGAGAAGQGATLAMQKMFATVCGGHLITMKGIAFGIALANSGSGFIGSILNFFAGCGVVIIFVWVAISFPLRFIDVILRLTVVGVATPVLVVCAVFKQSRSYIQIGISNVLYAGCLFAFTSVMFKLGSGFFEQLVNARIDSISADTPANEVVASSVALVGAGVVFAAMLKMAPSLASEFSQFRGGGGGVGDAATSFAASTVTLPVKAGAAVLAVKTGGASAGAAAAGGVSKSLGKDVTKKD